MRKILVSAAAVAAVQADLARRELTGENPVFDAWQANKEAERLAEQRRTERVTLDVEIHAACEGQIQYTSFFRDTAPLSQLIGQRHRPHLEEFFLCVCKGCGSAIVDPERLARYAELMTAHRNRTTD